MVILTYVNITILIITADYYSFKILLHLIVVLFVELQDMKEKDIYWEHQTSLTEGGDILIITTERFRL